MEWEKSKKIRWYLMISHDSCQFCWDCIADIHIYIDIGTWRKIREICTYSNLHEMNTGGAPCPSFSPTVFAPIRFARHASVAHKSVDVRPGPVCANRRGGEDWHCTTRINPSAMGSGCLDGLIVGGRFSKERSGFGWQKSDPEVERNQRSAANTSAM